MTANALHTISSGTPAGSGGGAARPSGQLPAAFDDFNAAFRRASGLFQGAAFANIAQAPTAAAQAPRSGAGTGANESPAQTDHRAPADADQDSSRTAPATPLTIDGLNAMLLVGGGTHATAGTAARAELRSASPSTEQPAPETSPASRHSDKAAAGTASSQGEDGRHDARADHRSDPGHDPGRPSSGREPPHDRPTDNSQRQGPGVRADAAKPAAASPVAAVTTDSLRTLAARALAASSGAAPKGIERAAPSPANSPFILRSGPAAARTDAAPRPGAAPSASPARTEAFAAQMSRILTTAAAKGGGTMTMRLAPESLGAVTVRVGVESGVVTARFEAANAAARDLLDASLSALRSSLEAKGLSVDRLQVELAPTAPPRAPEDQDAGARLTPPGDEPGTGLGGPGQQSGSSGGSADDRHAGESGGHGSARGGEESPAAEAPDDRTDVIDGAGHPGEVLYLGLDAIG